MYRFNTLSHTLFSGITAKFVIPIGLTLITLFIMVGVITVQVQKNALYELSTNSEHIVEEMSGEQVKAGKQSAELKVDQLTRLLAQIAPDAVVSYEFTALTSYADIATKDPDIAYIAFMDTENKILAESGSRSGIALNAFIEKKITYDGESLGHILVGVNHERSEKLVAAVKKRSKERFEEMENRSDKLLGEAAINLTLMFALVTLISIFLVFFIVQKVSKPIKTIADVAKELGEGDGDLTRRLPALGNDEIGQVATEFNTFIDKVHQVLLEIQSSVHEIVNSSDSINQASRELESSSLGQAESIEEINDTLQQMNTSTHNSAKNAEITTQIAAQASNEAEEGGKAVAETEEAMNRISDEITIIEDIAYKTNLLALNASIEAARASEHGKGFAVVAEEVRKLAERSQLAAQEINEGAHVSVEVAQRAGDLIKRIVPNISKTASLISEIQISSQQQSEGVSQVLAAAGKLDTLAQTNSRNSTQLAATAENLNQQSLRLESIMSFFKLGH